VALLGIRHPECDRGAQPHGQRNRISASLPIVLTGSIQRRYERMNPPPRMPAGVGVLTGAGLTAPTFAAASAGFRLWC